MICPSFSGGAVDLKNRKTIKLAKLQKLPKLLRVARLLKLLGKYSKFYSLILTVLGLVLSVHLYACLWIGLSSICSRDKDGNFPDICNEVDHNVVYLESLFYTCCLMLGVSASAVARQTGILLDQPSQDTTTSGLVFFVATLILGWGLAFLAYLFAHINIIVATRHKYMQVKTILLLYWRAPRTT
jgi:uncharacterized membrane protein